MSSTGTAPALTRATIGPVFTSAGFQSWYLACFPDCIVAVPQKAGSALMGPAAGAAFAGFGLLGALLGRLLKGSIEKKAQRLRQQAEATLQNTPTSRLQMKPNVVFRASQLSSISLRSVKYGGTLILPEIILETTDGKKHKYGIQPPDFAKATPELKLLYPNLCKTL